MKVRFLLKAATDDVHSELDALLSRLDLTAEPDYRRFLRFHAQVLPPVEDALAAGGLGDIAAGWTEYRRTAALAADLAELGEEMPAPVAVPHLTGSADLLGFAYVLEGSRLGGRVLRRQAGQSLPVRFLSGDGTLGPWPSVIAAMDKLLYSEQLTDEAKDAARRCFILFLNVAREAGIE